MNRTSEPNGEPDRNADTGAALPADRADEQLAAGRNDDEQRADEQGDDAQRAEAQGDEEQSGEEQGDEEPRADPGPSAEDQPVDHENADVPDGNGVRTAAVIAVVIALVLGGLSTWALLRSAGADHEQSCTAKAAVKYGSAKTSDNGLIAIARNRALAACSDSAF